jgi:hypothetical protein
MDNPRAWVSCGRSQPIGRPARVFPHGRLHPIDFGAKPRGGERAGLGVGRDRALSVVHAEASTILIPRCPPPRVRIRPHS